MKKRTIPHEWYMHRPVNIREKVNESVGTPNRNVRRHGLLCGYNIDFCEQNRGQTERKTYLGLINWRKKHILWRKVIKAWENEYIFIRDSFGSEFLPALYHSCCPHRGASYCRLSFSFRFRKTAQLTACESTVWICISQEVRRVEFYKYGSQYDDTCNNYKIHSTRRSLNNNK